MLSSNSRKSFFAVAACTALLHFSTQFATAQVAATAGTQTAFATPETGFLAFEQAVARNDIPALRTMLGPGSENLLSSGDPVEDQNARQRFVVAYQTKASVVRMDIDLATLDVGDDNWQLPLPLERVPEGWRFDTEAGREELINRRIGRNELNAIQASLAFVDAEREYASVDHNGDGVLQYTQRFMSTPGTQDGLYWPQQAGKPESPLGDAFAQASAAGYQFGSAPAGASAQPAPYYGYRYRILTGQGQAARGGAYDYTINGKVIGGFAMIAYPANYGVSGVMTFIVNHDGEVFQKDLGPDTATLASAIRQYNPDRTWRRT